MNNKALPFILAVLGALILGRMVVEPETPGARGAGQAPAGVTQAISYSELLRLMKDKDVAELRIGDGLVMGTRTDGGPNFGLFVQETERLADRAAEAGVEVTFLPSQPREPSLLFQIILSLLPVLLLITAYVWLMRKMRGGAGGGGGLFGFGRSKHKLITPDKDHKTFADVAGVEEAKADLEEIVDFLRDPSKFTRLGGKIPKGALLVGPPGTGKTLLAKAVAGEAKVPFFSISGSDFVEMFVGVGASRVRDLFQQAREKAPCIIFIDEIDAVGRHRGAGLGGGNDEREQTLNQMLVEMDGFEAQLGIIILAATNRPDVLDPALLRPGRFDRQIVVPHPDLAGRTAILNVHLRQVPTAPDVEAATVARGTPGFSGADLANLVNEAALIAARRNKRVVSMSEFEQARDKILMGAERRTLSMSEHERKLTAYHEAGHALAALAEPHSDPIHKATIVPRGRALGMVTRLPERDRVSLSYAKLRADLVVAMAGRAAEELIFGSEEVTTGASSDIEMASNLARRMVTEWGMSDRMGLVKYTEPQSEVFLGRQLGQTRPVADETAREIDHEVRRIVDESYGKAKTLLETKRGALDAIAKALLEVETLSGEELRALYEGDDGDRKAA